MRNTSLVKGVVTCGCGSGAFIGVETYPSGNRGHFRMKKNWDLNLDFEGSSYSTPPSIYCIDCGQEVFVSPAVHITGG